jgi:hypothetical protein
MNIAESVVNRLLNLVEHDLGGLASPAPPIARPEPTVPDPTFQGGMLDMTLQRPAGPSEGVAPGDPGNDAANAFEAVASGGTSLGGLLDTVSGQ